MTYQCECHFGLIGGNMELVLEYMIAELKDNTGTGLVGRSRVVDHLLDLRLAADSNPAVLRRVDDLLANVPGKTSVEVAWWSEALDGLADLASPTPVG